MAMIENTVTLIDKYHESRQEPPRFHLGGSLIGHKCERYLWLSFRWAVIEKFEGRLLRLFRRGQLEETQIIKDLRSIGVDIRSTQDKVDFGKHFSGSVDGIIYSGLSESNKKHVAEFKTHSKKSFDDLEKSGLQKSKPLHYAQMQVYMLGLKIDRGFYLAVCKDDDRIYTERIRLDKDFAEKLVEKAHRITMSDRLPPPITTDPTWYECKFCPAHEFCHKSKMTLEVNCRTCAHVTAKEDSTFYCERWEDSIPGKNQYEGCPSHVLHPDLVPWKMESAHDQWHAIYYIDGKPVLNGEDGFASSEILANPSECANPCEFTQALREEFDGRIVG
jgi:CRISPR/Cas system-associated exonuclease Cas4 (RecB family)